MAAKHQAALTNAQPGHSYGPAQIEIKLPTLYYHADHQRLSQQRLEIPHVRSMDMDGLMSSKPTCTGEHSPLGFGKAA